MSDENIIKFPTALNGIAPENSETALAEEFIGLVAKAHNNGELLRSVYVEWKNATDYVVHVVTEAVN